MENSIIREYFREFEYSKYKLFRGDPYYSESGNIIFNLFRLRNLNKVRRINRILIDDIMEILEVITPVEDRNKIIKFIYMDNNTPVVALRSLLVTDEERLLYKI